MGTTDKHGFLIFTFYICVHLCESVVSYIFSFAIIRVIHGQSFVG